MKRFQHQPRKIPVQTRGSSIAHLNQYLTQWVFQGKKPSLITSSVFFPSGREIQSLKGQLSSAQSYVMKITGKPIPPEVLLGDFTKVSGGFAFQSLATKPSMSFFLWVPLEPWGDGAFDQTTPTPRGAWHLEPLGLRLCLRARTSPKASCCACANSATSTSTTSTKGWQRS